MSHHDIAGVMSELYASFSSGDTSGWEQHIAEDVVCIGTDADEWLEGKSALLSVLHTQIAEMRAAGTTIETGTPVTSEHGDMVVLADRPTLHRPDGSSLSLRATVAGRLVDGEVVVHQLHMSAPAPNAEVVQTELTVPTS